MSHEDYLLGVSDLTGELMRFAISAASMVGGRRQKVAEVCHFVRTCSAGKNSVSYTFRRLSSDAHWAMKDWEPCTPYVRGLAKKQQVTNESLKKIEKGVCFLSCCAVIRHVA